MPDSHSEPVRALLNPNMKAANAMTREAFSKRQGLIVIGNCAVEYRGRASSKLAPGERIAVFKEDGSVLIHRPVGYEPVNWQPPGCAFDASAVGDSLQIVAVRRKPAESVRISFSRVYLVSVLNLVDEGEFALHATEEDMQKAILQMPSLIEDGLKPISYEKKVQPGFVDVYCEDKAGSFVVIEIKRKTADRQAALQLAKYVEAVKGIVNKKVRGILAAPHSSKGVQVLLETLGLEFKALNPRKCAKILSKPDNKRLIEFFGQK